MDRLTPHLTLKTVPFIDGEATCWRVGDSTFIAIPERGARLLKWSVGRAGDPIREVLHWPDLNSLERLATVRGGNPILFPFCARTFDRGEIHSWRDDAGVVRPMPLHGFARQGAFRVVSIDATGFCAMLVPDADARKAYPYDYEFSVRYRFLSRAMKVDLELANRGTSPIPWSAGHHFYLEVPWTAGLARRDYSVEIPATRSYRQDTRGRLEPGPRFEGPIRLDDPRLSSTTHAGLAGNQFSVRERDNGSAIRITTEYGNTRPDEAAFTTWTQDEDVPYYCFEPWMGPPNSPETRIGLHHVPPGETQRFTVELALEGAENPAG